MNPVLSLGPFQGITDYIYRNLFFEYFGGIDKFYTPFFTAIHTPDSKHLLGPELDPNFNHTKQLIPQILSNDPKEIGRFADFCEVLGYQEINLNLGCPFPRVARKKRGSGLLPYPELINQLLNDYFKNNRLNLSIKCRLGYTSQSEIDELIPVFNNYPLAEVIIHARTGIQLYKGTANCTAFGKANDKLNKTAAYNGDIFSVASFHSIQCQLIDVKHFMLGRGLLADPFLAGEIQGLTYSHKSIILNSFLNTLFEERLKTSKNPNAAIGRMKELWSYLRWSFNDPTNTWRIIRKANTIDLYYLGVKQIFQNYEWQGNGLANKTIFD